MCVVLAGGTVKSTLHKLAESSSGHGIHEPPFEITMGLLSSRRLVLARLDIRQVVYRTSSEVFRHPTPPPNTWYHDAVSIGSPLASAKVTPPSSSINRFSNSVTNLTLRAGS